ncbi:MAG: periplasmic copper chaperone [Frankiales bacterium]|nr:periplasmic copper chaperone [Frankiales bacterium]
MPAPNRASIGLAAVLLLTAPVLGACGAGRDSVTERERSAVDGAQVDAGDLQLRNVHLTHPSAGTEWAVGSDVPVVMYVVNRGAADRLLSVSAPGFATSVTMTPSAIDIGQGGLLRTGAPAAQPTASTAGPGSGPGSGSGTVSVVLSKLTKKLLPGQTVPVVFTFQRAGQVTLAVPVATS